MSPLGKTGFIKKKIDEIRKDARDFVTSLFAFWYGNLKIVKNCQYFLKI